MVDPLRSVDALITIPGGPSLVVEVDGAHHCIAYLGPRGPLNFNATNSWTDGSTQLRDWTLKKLGYQVASVMFYDVSPKALKNSADPSQQPHSSVVQTVARIVRSGMQASMQQHSTEFPQASRSDSREGIPAEFTSSAGMHSSSSSMSASDAENVASAQASITP